MKLMKDIREAILQDKFPEFIIDFMFNFFKNRIDPLDTQIYKHEEMENGYPKWIINALRSVSVELK
jgi:hypothetical protein